MKTLLFLLLAASALFVLLSYVVYRIVFHSPNQDQNDDFHLPDGIQYGSQREIALQMIRDTLAEESEDVAIHSRDGLKLRGNLYLRHENAPLAICCHGYRGTPARDFSGGTRALLAMGFNVLAIEERGCCRSEGHAITFGIKERYDILEWIRYAQGRFPTGTPIMLYGISMGASTVLMVSGMDLPEAVKGIVADCPYNAPVDIIHSVAESMHIPFPLLAPPLYCAARLFAGFRLKEMTAAKGVKNASQPILILHGEEDHFVPCPMSAEIAAASPLVERHTFPGASHGLSFLADKERYLCLVKDFAARCLASQPAEKAK